MALQGATRQAAQAVHGQDIGLENARRWYLSDAAERCRLAQATLEKVSKPPFKVAEVCKELVQALTIGAKDAFHAAIQVGARTFESRNDIKAACKQILLDTADGARLEEADADFLIALLQHHPRGPEKLRGCIGVTVGMHARFEQRCFHVLRTDGQEDFSVFRCVDNVPTGEGKVQETICKTLTEILQVHPSVGELVVQLMETHFPFPRVVVERHRNWVCSLLRLCTGTPALSQIVLRLLVRKMLEIDAEMFAIEERLDEADEPSSSPELRPMQGTKASNAAGTRTKDKQSLKHFADVLDVQMVLILEYLQKRLTLRMEEEEVQLVNVLLANFQSTVLLTHKARCVQFLWFYIASRCPAFAEQFLTVLLRVVFARDEAHVKRLISIKYVASFVVRALFLPTSYALRAIQYLIMFSREQQEVAEGLLASADFWNPEVVLFLSAVQAVCYMLCFHGDPFAKENSATGGESVLSEIFQPPGMGTDVQVNFTPVLHSASCPMGRIDQNVTAEFARCIGQHYPAVADEAMRQLVAARDGWLRQPPDGYCAGKAVGLDLFYPFDPLPLHTSAIFVQADYRQWELNSDVGLPDTIPKKPAELSDDSTSDVDFTDGPDAIKRGFNQSVEPSPAFHPLKTSMDISPMVTPELGAGALGSNEFDDDTFALPTPTVPLPLQGQSLMMHMLQQSNLGQQATAHPEQLDP